MAPANVKLTITPRALSFTRQMAMPTVMMAAHTNPIHHHKAKNPATNMTGMRVE